MKKKNDESLEKNLEEITETLVDIFGRLSDLNKRLSAIEERNTKSVKEPKRIQRVEPYMGETPEVRDEIMVGMKMDEKGKIQSMINAIRILPPNMVDEEGKQNIKNVEALVGFKVTEDMMDKAYGHILKD